MQLQEAEYIAWLASLCGPIASRRLNSLYDKLGSAKEVFFADDATLHALNVTPFAMDVLHKARKKEYWSGIDSAMQAGNIRFCARMDADFPQLLREIPDPPVGIFCVGKLPSTKKVAIIGSRHCTEYGRHVAHKIAYELAGAGIVIVSGLARGIDSVAHVACIAAGGKTLAVLGCGVDICYPPEHSELRADIIKNGAIISEFAPGVPPLPRYFPARNRIISGLCEALVVVEAGRKSGTLTTVSHANDQGREVLAVPGSIISEASAGTNLLIKDGAGVVTDYTDVLEALKITPPSKEAIGQNEPAAPSTQPEPPKKPNVQNLSPELQHLYGLIYEESVALEGLAAASGLPTGLLHLRLTQLETLGYIKKKPGAVYCAVNT